MSNLLNPWFWLVALGLFGAGYAVGSKYESTKCAADQVRALRAAQVVADEEDARREQVANTRETSREQIRIVYRTIREKVHETPIASDCGLDADGLRLWNASNNSTAAPLRPRLDGDLPGTATGPLGEVAGSAGQPHRGDGAVQPVPGSDAPAAGMPGREVAPRAALMGAPR